MTTRDDLNVDYQPSPRVIEIAAPSTELILQDLIDTLRVSEEGFSEGLAFDKLIDAAGKENLGGGVLVGITANLQDAQVAFEARRVPAETGVVTTGSGAGLNDLQTFVDSSADFVSAGIDRGSLVINFTDNSIADVYEVVSPTTLTTRSLVNGSINEYTIGDDYQVFNIVQCNIAGGNLVAEDEGDVQITSVVPTAFTQIVRTASSSATLQESQDIQYSSFNGGVTVDVTSGVSGTSFPTGTRRQPVSNWEDALEIANERGFSTFFVIGDATIDLSENYANFEFIGQSKSRTILTLDPAAQLTGAEFHNCTIQGTLDGSNILTDCNLLSINYVDGYVERCILNNTITLSGGGTAFLLDCYSGIPGSITPTIDMGGSGSALALRNYDGGIKLTNKTGSESASLDFNSGQVIIEDSVDAGKIVLRGSGRWQNRETYSGNAEIVDEMIRVDDVELIAFYERVEVDASGVSGTSYPIGTLGTPVNNLTDAYAIATARGLNKIHFTSDFTISNEAVWDGFSFSGESDNTNVLTVSASASTVGCVFKECTLTGSLLGEGVHAVGVTINNLTICCGDFHDCGFRGTTTFNGTIADQIRLINCYGAGNPATDRPTFDLGLPLVTVVRYTGDMLLTNKSSGNVFAMNLHGGRVELDSTITGGQYLVSGFGVLVDNSGVGATVFKGLLTNDDGIVSAISDTTYDGVAFSDILTKLLSMATGRIVESSPGVFEFYEQDNTTINFTLTKAGSERTRG